MQPASGAVTLEIVNRQQRIATTAALAVALAAVAWSAVPFAASGDSCGSAVTAVFGDTRSESSYVRRPAARGSGFASDGASTRRESCATVARGRLVAGVIVVGLAGAFAAGSYRLLRDQGAAD